MAGPRCDRGRPAHAAAAMPRTRDHEGARVGEQPRFISRQHRSEGPQLRELGAGGQLGRAPDRQLRQDAACALEPAEQHFAARLHCSNERRASGEQRDVRLHAALQQLRCALGDEVTRRGIGARCREPLRVIAFLGSPIDVRTGEEIRALAHRSLPHSFKVVRRILIRRRFIPACFSLAVPDLSNGYSERHAAGSAR